MSKLISIVVTCHGEASDLPVMLGCIENQMHYITAPHSETGVPVPLAATNGKCLVPREIIISSDGPFSGLSSNALRADRLIECSPKEGRVGHNTREPGIRAATGDWVVLQNADNYFVAGWLDLIEGHLRHPPNGMVVWDIVSNLWLWGTHGGSKLERGRIDLSAAAVRTDIAKEVGFPYREYSGDYDYLRDCKQRCDHWGLKVAKIDSVLAVHN